MAARSITCNIRAREADKENFTPRIKRKLDIESLLPDIRDGMLAAVMYGTARRSYEGDEGEQLLGKTGTCSDSASHVGWFVSYADQLHPKIVVAVLMRGHSVMDTGPRAAEIAGRMYHRLNECELLRRSAVVGAGDAARG